MTELDNAFLFTSMTSKGFNVKKELIKTEEIFKIVKAK